LVNKLPALPNNVSTLELEGKDEEDLEGKTAFKNGDIIIEFKLD